MWTPNDRSVRIPSVLQYRYRVSETSEAVLGFGLNQSDPVRSYLIVSRIGGKVDRAK